MRNEAPGDSFDADFRGTVNVEGDNGLCCKQTLRHDSRQSFPVAGVHNHIHGVDEVRHLIGRNESGESESVCQSELLDSLLVDLSEAAVTNEQKLCVGDAACDSGRSFDQVIVPFEVEQSADFSKDDVTLGQIQSGADFGWGYSGIQESLDIHTAVNGGKSVNGCDSGQHVLSGHGIADGDEVLAPASRQFFGAAAGEMQGCRLSVVEGGTVNGVDGGQFQLVCGQSSEDSGFGAVCVDNFGAEVSECLADGIECLQVLERIETANEFRQDDEVQSAFASVLFEGAFRSGTGACDQADVVTEKVVLVVDVEKGIFLSTADDQSSDDMSSAHGYWGGRSGDGSG